MRKYFKTADGYGALAVTLPNHLEIIIQEYRKTLFKAGAGTLCRFFVPFFFLGWIKKEEKSWGQSPNLTNLEKSHKPFQTGELIFAPEGSLFLGTNLKPEFLPIASIQAPQELQRGFFLGNYSKGTESLLQRVPPPKDNEFSSMIISLFDMELTEKSGSVTLLYSQPIASTSNG